MTQPAPWVPDEEVSECPLCTQKWLVLRGHCWDRSKVAGKSSKTEVAELGTSANRGFDGTISITNWHWIGQIVDLDFHRFSTWACLMTKVHGLNPIKTPCFVGWISINNQLSQSSHPIPWYPHKTSMIFIIPPSVEGLNPNETPLSIEVDRLNQHFFMGLLSVTLWLFNIAMEKGPCIDGLPINNGDFPWQTVRHNQMVNLHFPMVFLWFSS